MDAPVSLRVQYTAADVSTGLSTMWIQMLVFHQCTSGISTKKAVNKMHNGTLHINKSFKSRDSIVGIATGYGLDDQGVGVRVPVGARIFSSPCHPDWLRGPRSLLSSVYWGKVAGA
jgi:hypothetical protein